MLHNQKGLATLPDVARIKPGFTDFESGTVEQQAAELTRVFVSLKSWVSLPGAASIKLMVIECTYTMTEQDFFT